jgi:hypothetical protein
MQSFHSLDDCAHSAGYYGKREKRGQRAIKDLSGRESGAEVAKFFVDLIGRAHGSGYFGSKAVTKALTKALNSLFDSLFREIKLRSDLSESGPVLLAPNVVLQQVEKGAPAGIPVIFRDLCNSTIQLS